MSQVIRVSVTLRVALGILHRFLAGEFGEQEIVKMWKEFGVVYDAIELGQKGFHDHDFEVETRPITFTVDQTPFFQVWFYHTDNEGWVAYEYCFRHVCRFTDPYRIKENQWLRMAEIPSPQENGPKHELYQLGRWHKVTLEKAIKQFPKEEVR